MSNRKSTGQLLLPKPVHWITCHLKQLDSTAHANRSFINHTSTSGSLKKYKVLVFIDKDDNMIDDHNRTQCRGKQNIEIT